MVTHDKYDFTSARLGFRPWTEDDLEFMFLLNSDPRVMQFFPATSTMDECRAFFTRLSEQYQKTSYCYFLVEELEEGQFVGMVGLADVEIDTDFAPCVDIGWRIRPQFWKKGIAREAASRCLEKGFDHFGLEEIVAMAPEVNLPSIGVMKSIGMTYKNQFLHPKLKAFPELEKCALYSASRQQWKRP